MFRNIMSFRIINETTSNPKGNGFTNNFSLKF